MFGCDQRAFEMSVTDTQVRKARPRAQRYELSDGNGLELPVGANGLKSWVVLRWSRGSPRLGTIL